MKKFKTTLLLLIFVLISAPVLQSCMDDDEEHYLAIATFRASENDETYFTLDDGEKMYPKQTSFGTLKDGQRVYIYFDILDEKINGYDHYIDIKSIEKILTKNPFVMDEETVDSIGDDKIDITGLWLGDGYLNIRFQFYGTHDPDELHMVNLVYNEIEGATDEKEEDYLSLEFRHNAYDDRKAHILNGIVSFKGPFTQEEVKGLKIRYNSIFDGVKYIKINLKEVANRQNFSYSGSTFSGTPVAY